MKKYIARLKTKGNGSVEYEDVYFLAANLSQAWDYAQTVAPGYLDGATPVEDNEIAWENGEETLEIESIDTPPQEEWIDKWNGRKKKVERVKITFKEVR